MILVEGNGERRVGREDKLGVPLSPVLESGGSKDTRRREGVADKGKRHDHEWRRLNQAG